MSALKEKWAMETGWMQEPTAEVQHRGQEHPIEAMAQKGSGGFQVGWEMAQPLLTTPPCSIPGLRGAMQPGTANVTHGKPGQQELAKAHTSLHCFYMLMCDIWWTQADAEQTSLVRHKTNLLTPFEQLEMAQWFYVRGAICTIVQPCFWAHTRISKANLTVWSKQEKNMWPSYLTCHSHVGVTLGFWVCKHTRTICFVLMPWALRCLSQLMEPLQVFPSNYTFPCVSLLELYELK